MDFRLVLIIILSLIVVATSSSSSSSLVTFVEASPALQLLNTHDFTANSFQNAHLCDSDSAGSIMWCGNSGNENVYGFNLAPVSFRGTGAGVASTYMSACAYHEATDRLACTRSGSSFAEIFVASTLASVTSIDYSGTGSQFQVEGNDAFSFGNYFFLTIGTTTPVVVQIQASDNGQVATRTLPNPDPFAVCASAAQPNFVLVGQGGFGVQAQYSSFDISGGAMGASPVTTIALDTTLETGGWSCRAAGNFAYHTSYDTSNRVVRIQINPLSRVDFLALSFNAQRHTGITTDGLYLFVAEKANTKITIVDLTTFTEVGTPLALTSSIISRPQALPDNRVMVTSATFNMNELQFMASLPQVADKPSTIVRSGLASGKSTEQQFRDITFDGEGKLYTIAAMPDPSVIVAFDTITLSRLVAVTLDAGQGSHNTLLYYTKKLYCASFASPSKLVRLDAVGFTVENELVLPYNNAAQIALSHDHQYLYVGYVPAQVSRVTLSTFTHDSDISLTGVTNIVGMMPDRGFDDDTVWTISTGSPNVVSRFSSSAFSNSAAVITLPAGRNGAHRDMAQSSGFLFVLSVTSPVFVDKIQKSTSTHIIGTELASITPYSATVGGFIADPFIDSPNPTSLYPQYLYCFVGTNGVNRVVRVNSQDMTEVVNDNATTNTTENGQDGDDNIQTAQIGPDGKIYLTGYNDTDNIGLIIRWDRVNLPLHASFNAAEKQSVALDGPNDASPRLMAANESLDNNTPSRLFIVSGTTPPTVSLISVFNSSTMIRTATLDLAGAQQDPCDIQYYSPTNKLYILFKTGTAQLSRIDAATMSHENTATLNHADARQMFFDDMEDRLYILHYVTNPLLAQYIISTEVYQTVATYSSTTDSPATMEAFKKDSLYFIVNNVPNPSLARATITSGTLTADTTTLVSLAPITSANSEFKRHIAIPEDDSFVYVVSSSQPITLVKIDHVAWTAVSGGVMIAGETGQSFSSLSYDSTNKQLLILLQTGYAQAALVRVQVPDLAYVNNFLTATGPTVIVESSIFFSNSQEYFILDSATPSLFKFNGELSNISSGAGNSSASSVHVPMTFAVYRADHAENPNITDTTTPLYSQIASDRTRNVWAVSKTSPNAYLISYDLIDYTSTGQLLLPNGGHLPNACLFSHATKRVYVIAQEPSSTGPAQLYVVDAQNISDTSSNGVNVSTISGAPTLTNAIAADINPDEGVIYALFDTNPLTIGRFSIGNQSESSSLPAETFELASDGYPATLSLQAGEYGALSSMYLNENKTTLFVACSVDSVAPSIIVKIDVDFFNSPSTYFTRDSALTLDTAESGVSFRMTGDEFYLYVVAQTPNPPILVKIDQVSFTRVASYPITVDSGDSLAAPTGIRGLQAGSPGSSSSNSAPYYERLEQTREIYMVTADETPMRMLKIEIPSGNETIAMNTSLWKTTHLVSGLAADGNAIDGMGFSQNSFVASTNSNPPRIVRFIAGLIPVTTTTTTVTSSTTTTVLPPPTTLPPTTTSTTAAPGEVIPVVPPVITEKTTMQTNPVPTNIEDIRGNLFYAPGYDTTTCDNSVIRTPTDPCVTQFHSCHSNTRFNHGGGACPALLDTCVVNYAKCLIDSGKTVNTDATTCSWSTAYSSTGVDLVSSGSRDLPDCDVFVKIFGVSYFNCAPSYTQTCGKVVDLLISETKAASPEEITKTDLTQSGNTNFPRGMMPIVISKSDTATTCTRPYFDLRCKCPSEFERLRLFEPSYLFAAASDTEKRSPSNYDICYDRAVSTFENVSFAITAASSSSRRADVDAASFCPEDAPDGRTLRQLKVLAESSSSPGTATGKNLAVCAPRDTNAFILNSVDGSCYSPRVNVSCKCGDSTSVGVPITYLNESTNRATSGIFIVCNYKLPKRVTTQQIVTTTITVGAGLSAGPGAAGLQAAATVSMIDCSGANSEAESQGGRFALIPITIGDSDANGLLFLLTAIFGSFFILTLMPAILALYRWRSACCNYCSGHDKAEAHLTENPRRTKYLALKKLYDSKQKQKKEGAINNNNNDNHSKQDEAEKVPLLITDNNDDKKEVQTIHKNSKSNSTSHSEDTSSNGSNQHHQDQQHEQQEQLNSSTRSIISVSNKRGTSFILDSKNNDENSPDAVVRSSSVTSSSSPSPSKRDAFGVRQPALLRRSSTLRVRDVSFVAAGPSSETDEHQPPPPPFSNEPFCSATAVNDDGSPSPLSSSSNATMMMMNSKRRNHRSGSGSDNLIPHVGDSDNDDQHDEDDHEEHQRKLEEFANRSRRRSSVGGTSVVFGDDSSSVFRFGDECDPDEYNNVNNSRSQSQFEIEDGDADGDEFSHSRQRTRRRSSLKPGKIRKLKKTYDEKLIITYIDDKTGKEKQKKMRKKFRFGHLDNQKLGYMYHFWNSCATFRHPGFFCFLILRIFFQGLAYEGFYLAYRQEPGTWVFNLAIASIVLSAIIVAFFVYLGYLLKRHQYCPYDQYRFLYTDWPEWARRWVAPDGMWPDVPVAFRSGLAWDDYSGTSDFIMWTVPMNYIKGFVLAAVTSGVYEGQLCFSIFYVLVALFVLWCVLLYIMRPVYRFWICTFTDGFMSFFTGLFLLFMIQGWEGSAQLYLVIVYAGMASAVINQLLGVHEFVVGFWVEIDPDEEENNLDWETDTDNDADVIHREKPKMKEMLVDLKDDDDAQEALQMAFHKDENKNDEDDGYDNDLFLNEDDTLENIIIESSHQQQQDDVDDEEIPIIANYDEGYVPIIFEENDNTKTVEYQRADRLEAGYEDQQRQENWQVEEFESVDDDLLERERNEQEELLQKQIEALLQHEMEVREHDLLLEESSSWKHLQSEKQKEMKKIMKLIAEREEALAKLNQKSMSLKEAVQKRNAIRKTINVNERIQHQRHSNLLMTVEAAVTKEQKLVQKQQQQQQQASSSSSSPNNNKLSSTMKNTSNKTGIFSAAASATFNGNNTTTNNNNNNSRNSPILSLSASVNQFASSTSNNNFNNTLNNTNTLRNTFVGVTMPGEQQQQKSSSSAAASSSSPHYVKNNLEKSARGNVGASVTAMMAASKLKANAELAKKAKIEQNQNLVKQNAAASLSSSPSRTPSRSTSLVTSPVPTSPTTPVVPKHSSAEKKKS